MSSCSRAEASNIQYICVQLWFHLVKTRIHNVYRNYVYHRMRVHISLLDRLHLPLWQCKVKVQSGLLLTCWNQNCSVELKERFLNVKLKRKVKLEMIIRVSKRTPLLFYLFCIFNFL